MESQKNTQKKNDNFDVTCVENKSVDNNTYSFLFWVFLQNHTGNE